MLAAGLFLNRCSTKAARTALVISGDGLGGSLGGLEGSLGASGRCLRGPWGSLGGPWGASGGPRASSGGSGRHPKQTMFFQSVLGGSWGALGVVLVL